MEGMRAGWTGECWNVKGRRTEAHARADQRNSRVSICKEVVLCATP